MTTRGRFDENHNPSVSYTLDGDFVNEISKKLNEDQITDVTLDQVDNKLLADIVTKLNNNLIGTIEIISLDPEQIKAATGQKMRGTWFNGNPVQDWMKDIYFAKFVGYGPESKAPVILNLACHLHNKMLAFSDRSGLQIDYENETYKMGSKDYGMLPIFYPGEKIPVMYNAAAGRFTPMIGPPAETLVYNFTQSSHTIELEVKDQVPSVKIALQVWDPKQESWYQYDDQTLAVDYSVIERMPLLQFSGSFLVPVKDKTRVRLIATQEGDPQQQNDSPVITLTNLDLIMTVLGRFWRTDNLLFPAQQDNPDFPGTYDLTYNSEQSTTGSLSRRNAEPDFNANDRGKATVSSWRAHANTRVHWRDQPMITMMADGSFEFMVAPGEEEERGGFEYPWTVRFEFTFDIAGGMSNQPGGQAIAYIDGDLVGGTYAEVPSNDEIEVPALLVPPQKILPGSRTATIYGFNNTGVLCQVATGVLIYNVYPFMDIPAGWTMLREVNGRLLADNHQNNGRIWVEVVADDSPGTNEVSIEDVTILPGDTKECKIFKVWGPNSNVSVNDMIRITNDRGCIGWIIEAAYDPSQERWEAVSANLGMAGSTFHVDLGVPTSTEGSGGENGGPETPPNYTYKLTACGYKSGSAANRVVASAEEPLYRPLDAGKVVDRAERGLAYFDCDDRKIRLLQAYEVYDTRGCSDGSSPPGSNNG